MEVSLNWAMRLTVVTDRDIKPNPEIKTKSCLSQQCQRFIGFCQETKLWDFINKLLWPKLVSRFPHVRIKPISIIVTHTHNFTRLTSSLVGLQYNQKY